MAWMRSQVRSLSRPPIFQLTKSAIGAGESVPMKSGRLRRVCQRSRQCVMAITAFDSCIVVSLRWMTDGSTDGDRKYKRPRRMQVLNSSAWSHSSPGAAVRGAKPARYTRLSTHRPSWSDWFGPGRCSISSFDIRSHSFQDPGGKSGEVVIFYAVADRNWIAADFAILDIALPANRNV